MRGCMNECILRERESLCVCVVVVVLYTSDARPQWAAFMQSSVCILCVYTKCVLCMSVCVCLYGHGRRVPALLPLAFKRTAPPSPLLPSPEKRNVWSPSRPPVIGSAACTAASTAAAVPSISSLKQGNSVLDNQSRREET